jgi:hypothetical protein
MNGAGIEMNLEGGGGGGPSFIVPLYQRDPELSILVEEDDAKTPLKSPTTMATTNR